jgi:SAM-dependent methyltransferase
VSSELDESRDFDAERRASHDLWEGAAAGWSRQRATWGEQSAAVADWMIDALGLAAGQRMLELAAGIGEVGFRALPRITPAGTLISSDQSQAMVDAAREYARELGLDEAAIELRVLDGEWIDLEVASVDRVLCRWGYMLMADPAAALRETRRVLRSGGRVALAVWAERGANQWAAIPNDVMIEHGLFEPPQPGTPGPFALGDPELLRGMLEDAGFGEIEIAALEVPRRADDFAQWWAMYCDLSFSTRSALDRAEDAEVEAVEAAVAARLAPFSAANGELEVPGRTLVAVAEA